MSVHLVFYMVGIGILLNGIIPCLEFVFSDGRITLNGYLKVNWVINTVVVYPILGYHLSQILRKANVKHIMMLWLFNIITIGISAFMTYKKGLMDGEIVEWRSQTFFESFVIINAICIFATFFRLFKKCSTKRIEKVIFSIGKYSFGIYLFHAWVLERLYSYNVVTLFQNIGINYMIAAFLMVLYVLGLSYVLTLIISHFPVLKKMIGY